MIRHFVSVILPLPLKQLFTYELEEAEYQFLLPGMRVAVPFGKSKVYTALVYSLENTFEGTYEPKRILSILDATPIVTEIQLKHWSWMADYYMCALGEVYKTAVPTALILEGETHLRRSDILKRDHDALIAGLSDNAYIVLDALPSDVSLPIQTLSTLVQNDNIFNIIEVLLNLKLVVVEEQLTARYTPKFRNEYAFPKHFLSDAIHVESLELKLKNAPKQLEIVNFFIAAASHSKVITDLDLRNNGLSPAALKALVSKGVLEKTARRVDRVLLDPDFKTIPIKPLNPPQIKALAAIKSHFNERKVALLHGVTASGKTEVYAALIQEALSSGKQVLYLLPEIALTTQLITRLQSYFGTSVSVYHSKYNLQERVEVWQNTVNESPKAQLIVGARSALFLPFKKLGLVIVDEEHENSFKQFDPAPRYHARDSAIVLAHISKAAIVLGSATPSLESMQNVLQHKYGLAELTKRHANIAMPSINLIDLKEQYKKKKMKLQFSEPLRWAIEETLSAGEQVILFQNRRGYAPIVECFSCGHTPHCKSCDVSLTFHSNAGVLRCHYCGYEEYKKSQCNACGSLDVSTKGFGTEQVVASLEVLFPEARVGRMDLDTTRAKDGYQQIIDRFEQHEIDILVGTQMLSKGLDFRDVGLVGVMAADALLNFPDFRAHEKTFQLLTQVAGRAGRTEKKGKVLIQTYQPEHQILQQVTSYEFQSMCKEQLYQREIYKYPPFNKIIKITLKHKEYNKLNDAADWFAKGLKNIFKTGVLGPEFPVVSRVRNQYIKHILLKVPHQYALKQVKDSLLRLEKSFEAVGPFKGVRIVFNVDPY